MRVVFRTRISHPLFPDLPAAHAIGSKGRLPVLAGTYPELMRAATAGAQASRAVFVLTFSGGPALSDFERDRLWETYQVPVLAMLRDRAGRLLAYECEAQSGMHVADVRLVPHDTLDSSACECGRPGQRLYPESLALTR